MAEFILRHKLLVVLAWLALSAISIATIGKLGPRLDYKYTTPGQPGYEANLKITERFGLDAEFEATLPILRLPSGTTMDSPEARSLAAKTFAAAYDAGPLAVADFATTGDPLFIIDQGRATWAMMNKGSPVVAKIPCSSLIRAARHGL